MEEERKWENLDSDCLVSIFCYLGLEELTVALPFVCKSWHEASLDPQCWKRIDFFKLDFCYGGILKRSVKQKYGVEGSNFERRLKQTYGVRSSFSFSSFMKLCVDRSHGSAVELAIPYGCGDSILQDLASASIECPNLKVVKFLEISLDVVKKLPALISKWKELEILRIPLQLFSFTEILEQIRINCPKFIGLHLHGYFNNTRVKAIVRCVPRLKILVIDGARIKKNDLMEMLDGCNELQVFSASDCAGFKVDAEILMKTSNIMKVEFKNTPRQCKIEIDYLF